MKKGRVTLAHVAREAGVTAQTVSKIINGNQSTTSVSEATRDLVLEVAKRLGYRPNTLARAVRQGRVGSLGMLVSMDPHRTFLSSDFIFGAVSQAEQMGTEIKLTHYNEGTMMANDLPRFIREVMVDGLLANYFDNSESTLVLMENIRQRNIPTIWLNRQMPEDSIYFDDYGAGRLMAEMMLEYGLKQVAYIDISDKLDKHYSRRERPRGFCDQVLENGGIPVVTLNVIPGNDQIGFLREWFQKHPEIEAVVGYGVDTLPGVIQVATENGRRIGKDFFVGFFGSDNDLRIYPRFVVEQQMNRFGEEAVKMLVEKIENPGKALSSRMIEFAPGPRSPKPSA